MQALFLQGHSTCFGRKRPSSGVFKTSTAATGTCVIVAGKSSHLLIRAIAYPTAVCHKITTSDNKIRSCFVTITSELSVIFISSRKNNILLISIKDLHVRSQRGSRATAARAYRRYGSRKLSLKSTMVNFNFVLPCIIV